MPTLNWIGKDKIINHHLDTTDSDFSYFMVFDTKDVDRAYSLDKAKQLIADK